MRAIDEAAAAEVEPEAEQHVRVLEAGEPRPLQQRLVHVDRAADLSLLAIQVAEDHVDLERVGVEPRRLGQLVDREVDLAGDEEVEPDDVVRRLPRLAPVDPAAVAQLVALPRLADREAEQQRDERRRGTGRSPPSWRRLAGPLRTRTRPTDPGRAAASSTSSRTAPLPPPAGVTKSTRVRTSATASAGAAEKPTRASTGRSSRSSPM